MALFLGQIHAVLKRAVSLSVIHSHSRNMCLPPTEFRTISPNLEFSQNCDEAIKERLEEDMKIHEDFITIDEEKNLLEELELKFRRTRYQFDHWDDVRLNFLLGKLPVQLLNDSHLFCLPVFCL